MGFVIQSTDDPPFVTCKTCDGRGYTTALKWGVDPDWCPECGGAKESALDMSRLDTLAHNLAIAAALCAAHEIGLNESEGHRLYHEHGYRVAECWAPGCGRPSP